MQTDAVIAPEGATLEAVTALLASFVAISALDAACIALFDGQHIQQTVYAEVCGQRVKITVSRDPEVLPTLWTWNGFSNSARSLNALQAMKTKAVQTWQLFGMCELAHTH